MNIISHKGKTRYVFPELGEGIYLTQQEKNCILCAMKGMTCQETAKELNIDYYTVILYRKHIIRKFNGKRIAKIVELIKTTDFLNKLK
jgi:DNA-binding CsgD family transcriptional regulator